MLVDEISKQLSTNNNDDSVEVAIFPPFPFLRDVAKMVQDNNNKKIKIGGNKQQEQQK